MKPTPVEVEAKRQEFLKACKDRKANPFAVERLWSEYTALARQLDEVDGGKDG